MVLNMITTNNSFLFHDQYENLISPLRHDRFRITSAWHDDSPWSYDVYTFCHRTRSLHYPRQ